MPAIDFPNSPSVNDTHTVGNRVWKWNGTVWEVVRSTVPYSTGPTGANGSTGPTGLTGATGASVTGNTGNNLVGFNSQTGTTYTLVLSDKDKLIQSNNAGAITVTIPPSVFSANDQISIVQTGVGQVSFAQGAGVTITSNGATASAPKLRAQYSAASVICTASNTFLILGDIS